MVELSGCGSINGKWEVIRGNRLVCSSPSNKQSRKTCPPPHASFIIICLAGCSESRQTEHFTSILLFLSEPLISCFFILLNVSRVQHFYFFLLSDLIFLLVPNQYSFVASSSFFPSFFTTWQIVFMLFTFILQPTVRALPCVLLLYQVNVIVRLNHFIDTSDWLVCNLNNLHYKKIFNKIGLARC